MSLSQQLPALQIVVPLMCAPLCILFRDARISWWIAFVTNLICTLIAMSLVAQTADGSTIRYALGGWAAPSGIEYYIDIVNAALLLVVSGISLFVTVYAREGATKEVAHDRQYLFYAAWLLCLTGLLGIVITGDAFNAFVFLEISSLSTYMLISIGRERNALTAAFRYLIIGSIGASFILLGVGFLYAATGTLNMVDLAERLPQAESTRTVLIAFTFLTVGLMIKAAIFPLHAWLANAYNYAPITVTAFLSGTATKVSLYLLLRFFFHVFGGDYSFGEMLLNFVLLPAAVLGFVTMSLVAVFQTDLRRMLAYSSVAQIGYIVAGICMVSPLGVGAGFVHIINHAMIKAALFMAAGCIFYRLGHAHIPSFAGLVRKMPLTVAAFAISGLSLIGVPLTAGFISKFNLVAAAIERGWWLVVAMILFSSICATIYIGRTFEVMVFRQSRDPAVEPGGMHEAPWLMLIPMWTLIGLSVVLGIFGNNTLAIAMTAAEKLLGGVM